MAGTIQLAGYYRGQTTYAQVRNLSAAIWNGSSFEAYNAGNWGNYDQAMTEDGSSGHYTVAFPGSISAGTYLITFFRQVGASPAEATDDHIGNYIFNWDGTNEVAIPPSQLESGVWGATRSSYTTDGTFGQMLQSIRSGTAQAGAAGTITLDASASGTDDFYNNCVIQITGGTGANQSRIISDYVGSTKVASVNDNWVTTPDNTSVFLITAFGSIPGASAPTAAQVADAVWDEARAGHVSAGTFGEGVLAEDLNTAAKASVNTEVDTALTDIDLDHIAKTSYGANPAVGSLFDLIMNKNGGQTFDQSSDSLEAIKDTGSGPSAGQIADAVWDEALNASSHASAGSAGERLQAIDDKLPTGTLSDFDESSDNVNLNADQSGVTIGTVDDFGSTAQSRINTEVVDVLRVDTISELTQGQPATTPTFATAIMLLYMALRNEKTDSATEVKIRDNAGTVITKATLSESGGEFSKGQLQSPGA